MAKFNRIASAGAVAAVGVAAAVSSQSRSDSATLPEVQHYGKIRVPDLSQIDLVTVPAGETGGIVHNLEVGLRELSNDDDLREQYLSPKAAAVRKVCQGEEAKVVVQEEDGELGVKDILPEFLDSLDAGDVQVQRTPNADINYLPFQLVSEQGTFYIKRPFQAMDLMQLCSGEKGNLRDLEIDSNAVNVLHDYAEAAYEVERAIEARRFEKVASNLKEVISNLDLKSIDVRDGTFQSQGSEVVQERRSLSAQLENCEINVVIDPVSLEQSDFQSVLIFGSIVGQVSTQRLSMEDAVVAYNAIQALLDTERIQVEHILERFDEHLSNIERADIDSWIYITEPRLALDSENQPTLFAAQIGEHTVEVTVPPQRERDSTEIKGEIIAPGSSYPLNAELSAKAYAAIQAVLEADDQ